MVIDGYQWLWIVIEWLLMVINGYGWLLMAINGYGWLSNDINGY